MTAGKIDFKSYNEGKLVSYINDFKKRYGKRLVIPAHYYVSSDVFQFADITGDSYKLAVEVSRSDAEWVVFCGVRFMAEGVNVLSPDKKVLIPDLSAGCPDGLIWLILNQGEEFLKKLKNFQGKDLSLLFI